MKKTKLLEILNKIAPLELAEDWDNCGMQVDLGKEEISKVLVAMELTSDIIAEAKEKGADMIICHHPVLLGFSAITSLKVSNIQQNNLIELVKNGIEVYSSHTCFDAAEGGNNDFLSHLVGVSSPRAFCGNICRIGELDESMTFDAFAKKVSEVLGHPLGMLCGGSSEKLIKTVAVCTGAGAEYWEDAVKEGADAFITGEIKHHQASYMAQSEICYINAGHAGTEWIFTPNMAAKLAKYSDGDLEIIATESHQEPYNRVL